jgi:hypothetical protein
MNACRAGSPCQKGFEACPFRPLVVVGQLMRDADDTRIRQTTGGELPAQLFHVDTFTWGQLLAAIRPFRKAGPHWVRAGDADAHRRAALDPDDDDIAALLDVHLDGADNS